jgi:hypothetical protein
MTPTTAARRALPHVECPRCGVQIEDVEQNAGWVQRSAMGTRVGTYPDMPPSDFGPDGGMAQIESFPELDRFVIRPCGDVLYPNEAAPILTALRQPTSQPRRRRATPRPL